MISVACTKQHTAGLVQCGKLAALIYFSDEKLVILGSGAPSRPQACMLVRGWHAGSPRSHVQSAAGRVSCDCLPAGWTAHSQYSAVWACGAFVVGFCTPKPRSSWVRRSLKKISAVEVTKANQASPHSMLDRLQDRAAALGGKCLAIGYKNSRTKVPWQCQHGHTWDASPANVLNGTWCLEFGRNRQRIPLQRLQDHARARGGQCLSTSKYNRSKAKVPWQCKLGDIWEATPNNVLYSGSWCPTCSRKGRTRKKRSLKDLQEHAASLGGRCLATTYEGMTEPVPWQCQEGHTWRARPGQVLLKAKTWCPVCAGRARLDLHQLQEHAARRGGECLAEKYVNSKSKVPWKCKDGHTWQATPNNVLHHKRWCPHCRKIVGAVSSQNEIWEKRSITKMSEAFCLRQLPVVLRFHGTDACFHSSVADNILRCKTMTAQAQPDCRGTLV